MSVTISGQGVSSLSLAEGANVFDSVNYKVEFNQVLIDNIFISMRTRVGQTVDGRYVQDGAQAPVVILNRVKRINGKPRTVGLLGSSSGTSGNNGALNKETAYSAQTDQYAIMLAHTYDITLSIPELTSGISGLDLVNKEVYNMAMEISEYIDSCTIATMLSAVCKNSSGGTTGFVVEPATGVNQLDDLKNTVKALKKGDIKNGIATFTPTVCLAKVDYALDLLSSTGVLIGGSNYAQEMIGKGVLSPDKAFAEYGTGTLGNVLNIPVVQVEDILWDFAKKWLGSVEATNTFIDAIKCITCDYMATARGIADQSIDIRLSANSRATNILPLYRWGVDVFFPKGIVPVVANATTNPYNKSTNKMEVLGWGNVA